MCSTLTSDQCAENSAQFLCFEGEDGLLICNQSDCNYYIVITIWLIINYQWNPIGPLDYIHKENYSQNVAKHVQIGAYLCLYLVRLEFPRDSVMEATLGLRSK